MRFGSSNPSSIALRNGYGVVAADRQRRRASGGEALVEGDDVGLGRRIVEQRMETHVPDVGDAAEIEWIDPKDVMGRAHQRRKVAHRARTVAGADPVRRAAVERHAGDADVDAAEIEPVRRAQESGYLGEARCETRIEFAVVADLVIEKLAVHRAAFPLPRPFATEGETAK